MKNFYNYVVDKYIEEDTPFGDFAVDLKSDKEITEEMKENSLRIFAYLDDVDMCDDARKIYEHLKKEWQIMFLN